MSIECETRTWEEREKVKRKEFIDTLFAHLMVLLIFVAIIVGLYFVGKVNKNNEPSFREPDGYILVYVKINDFWSCSPWGYISEEDYQKFLDGELKGNLRIEHPYEDGKCQVVSVSIIESIETGDVSGVDW